MSLSRAVRALHNRGRRRPGFSAQRPYLATNLSYVLHEHSRSDAVQQTVRDIDAHAERIQQITGVPAIVAASGHLSDEIDVWLVATLGAVPWYRQALQQVVNADRPLACVDGHHADRRAFTFFRGPATLSLDIPDHAGVGVASVVLRPGGHDLQVHIAGPFTWATEADEVLRALERLIQRDVDQWMPPRGLWLEPAEATLGSEIVHPRTR